MRGAHGSSLFFALVLLASCGGGGGPENGLVRGQTDFTSNELGEGNHRGGWDDYGAPGATMDAEGKTSGPPAPPQGRTGEVEEGDIYKVEGNKLYYLNTYRGFIIYDLADPQHPRQVSRLPVFGYPIEMFIQKNTVYALLRDALYLTQVKGKLQFQRHNVSQLVSIDISNPAQPKVLQTVDIVGELREGVSRKIEDTIYVVSYRHRYYYSSWNYLSQSTEQKEQAWVYSFNVADPKNLALVEKLQVFEGGGYSFHDPHYQVSVSRNFQDVTISATANTLMVVENWRTYGWVSGSKNNCGSSTSQQQAIVSLIDISDPQGQIRLHAKFDTSGQLGDQFKQTYVYSPQTGKATYFGIFARQEWSSSGCSGSSFVKNTLEAWDVTDGESPKRVGELPFGKPNETVRGSTFDAERGVAFAITARNMDPLYAISIADPTALKVQSEVDGLSGDMNVFRFTPGKKFLIGIGRDGSDTCTGFGDPTTSWATQVAVSIIDVQDLAKIRLVQRKCVTVQGASWSGSSVNWNRDQAHKMIGMHSDGTVNAITVPIYYTKRIGPDDWYWYRYETAVGLMTWDLAKYDPAKDELQQTVLENYGTIVHPQGQVRRSIIFTHEGTSPRRMVLNLSDTHLSLVDIGDLNSPVPQAVLEIAPYQAQIFRFGDYLVEHIQPGWQSYYSGDGNESASEFRVKKIGGSLEETEAVASFTVGQVEKVVKHKSSLILFHRVYPESAKQSGYGGEWHSEVVTYSLADPTKPVKMGNLKLPGPLLPYYWYWMGDGDSVGGAYWFNLYGNSNNFVTTDRGLAFLATTTLPSGGTQRKLVFLDLQDPGQLTMKEIPLASASSWAFLGLVPEASDPDVFYLTYKTKVGEVLVDGTTFQQFKYYAQRWSWAGSDWIGEYAINLPGQLMKTWTRGAERLFLTYDYTYKKIPSENKWWSSTWQHSFRLNLLRGISPAGVPLASLLDFHNFQSYYLNDVILDGDRLLVNAYPNQYYGSAGADPALEDTSDHLMIFELGGSSLAQVYAGATGTYRARMMGTYQGKLFLDLPGDGLLVIKVDDPAQLQGLRFLRTLGYTTHVELVEGTAYAPAGYFGVYQLDLGGGAAIPAL